jgi:micrococcal nuclease
MVAVAVLLLALAGGGACKHPQTTAPDSSREVHRVTRVIDGDTIAVEQVDQKVRLTGINTPETVHPTKRDECFGPEASARMLELVGGKEVRLERDPIGSDKDWRGQRLVRYVYAEGRLVNAEMIKEGYARVEDRFRFSRLQEFRAYEREAREARRGLWAPNACGADISSR